MGESLNNIGNTTDININLIIQLNNNNTLMKNY